MTYRALGKILKGDTFIRIQMLSLFLVVAIDWILLPVVTKLEGLYLPIFMISFFMLLGASEGIVQPLFKNVKVHNIYLFAIYLDILQIASYFLFFYDELVFTYTILTIFTIQTITFEIARIHTIELMSFDLEVKKYLILRSFVISCAVIFGATSTMILDILFGEISILLVIMGVLGILALPLQIKLYYMTKERYIKYIQDDRLVYNI